MNREQLYDNLPLITLEDINQAAHPGGGPTIVDSVAELGLSEDLYEAQLKGVDVARPAEVLVSRIAQLSEELEAAGFAKYAESVDAVLKHASQQAEHTRLSQEITGNLKELDSILDQHTGLKEDYFTRQVRGYLAPYLEYLDERDLSEEEWANVLGLLEYALRRWKQISEDIEEFALREKTFQLIRKTWQLIKMRLGRQKKGIAYQLDELRSRAKEVKIAIDKLDQDTKAMAEIEGEPTAQKINTIFDRHDLTPFKKFQEVYSRLQQDNLSEEFVNFAGKKIEETESLLRELKTDVAEIN